MYLKDTKWLCRLNIYATCKSAEKVKIFTGEFGCTATHDVSKGLQLPWARKEGL
jgi:hypothetical protein